MNFTQALRLQFGFCIPILYFLHGFIYIKDSNSAFGVFLVYAVKISYLGVVLFGVVTYGLRIFSNTLSRRVMAIILSVVCINIIGVVLNVNQMSVFYFFADLLGFLVFIIFFSVLHHHFLLQKNLQSEIFYLCKINIVGYAAGLIFYYFLSDGMKVSTPPDNAIIIAFCLGVIALNWGMVRKLDLILVLGSVVVIVALSGMRVLIVVPLLCLSLLVVRVLYVKGVASLIGLIGLTVVGAFLIGVTVGSEVAEKLMSIVAAVDAVFGRSEVSQIDGSILQRAVEAELIFEQMNKNLSAYFFGAGFGALYENAVIINEHYASLQHHAHSTPVIVLFRNGVIGLLFYVLILLIAISKLFGKDNLTYVAALAVVCQWLSALFDQYAYWAFNFAFALAVMFVYQNKLRRIRAG